MFSFYHAMVHISTKWHGAVIGASSPSFLLILSIMSVNPIALFNNRPNV